MMLWLPFLFVVIENIPFVNTAPQNTYDSSSNAVSFPIQDPTSFNPFIEQPADPIVDAILTGGDQCTSDNSLNNLSDENIETNPMVRRGAVLCPPERVIEAPGRDSTPGQTPKLRKQISPPNPPDGTQSGDQNRHCTRLGTGLTLYATCAGPEVAREKDGLLGWVMDCYLGYKARIPQRHPWQKPRQIAQYCCFQGLSEAPGYWAKMCKKMTPNVELAQWTVYDLADWIRQYMPGTTSY